MNICDRAQLVAAMGDAWNESEAKATCRMTDVAKHTVLKLLKDIGCACAAYHNANVPNLRVRRVRCDEV
jgi:hypothetical protein